jgi:hypothetical protein
MEFEQAGLFEIDGIMQPKEIVHVRSSIPLGVRVKSDDITLAQAQDILETNLPKGMKCPCCNQFAKRYKYKFSENICRYLMILYKIYRQTPDKFTHVTEILKHDAFVLMSRDFLRPAFYKLIEEQAVNDPDKKKRSGYWRLTEKGVEFCERKIAIPKYVLIYNNEVLGFEGDSVYITDFEGEYFNYAELMSR